MTQDTYALAVHGGAGNAPLWSNSHEREALKESLALALETGQSMLRRGATSVDTVEAVTRSLEDDPYFNAGHGSFPNYNGEFELDASIMEGGSGNCGAVAGVRTIRNPVSAARAVMDHSPHVLLCGTGADEFAKKFGMDLVESDSFRTEHRMAAWPPPRREGGPERGRHQQQAPPVWGGPKRAPGTRLYQRSPCARPGDEAERARELQRSAFAGALGALFCDEPDLWALWVGERHSCRCAA